MKIQPESGLTNLANGQSTALTEIINRSLVNIQTSKSQWILHRIGTHDLYGPDYRLVCAWAEELSLTEEEVLECLLETRLSGHWNTTLIEGRFESLLVDGLYVSIFPVIKGMMLENLQICWSEVTNLDLSGVPNLKKLYCYQNELKYLDLSAVPNLTQLFCGGNQITHLDLSWVPGLEKLYCYDNQLISLDLSVVNNIIELYCDDNLISELNIQNLTQLCEFDHPKMNFRIIQRPDQNFK